MTNILNQALTTSDVTAGTGAFTTLERFEVGALSPSGVYTSCQITLQPASASTVDLILANVWIGHAAPSGDDYDFDGNQVQVTFGGSKSVTLITGGAAQQSDVVAFVLDTSKPLIIAYDSAASGSSRNVRRLSPAGADFNLYFKNASGQDSGTTDKGTGDYTLAASILDIVTAIDAFTGSSATWNPADKSSQFNLADANLRASTVTGGNYGVRATGFATSGKYYFEWTQNTSYHNYYDGVGIEKTSAAFGDFYAGTSGAIVANNGAIVINGINAVAGYYSGGVGVNVDVCVDLDAQLFWARGDGPGGGDWNGNPSADPATGVGGMSFASTVTAGAEVRPAVASAGGTIDGNARFSVLDWIHPHPAGFIEWPGVAAPVDVSAAPGIGLGMAVIFGNGARRQPVVIIST